MSYEKVQAEIFKCKCEAKNRAGVVCGHKWEDTYLHDRCPKCTKHSWNGGSDKAGRPATTFLMRGKNLTLSQWSKETGIPRQRIYYRIINGWNPDDVLLDDKLSGGRK